MSVSNLVERCPSWTKKKTDQKQVGQRNGESHFFFVGNTCELSHEVGHGAACEKINLSKKC